MKRLLLLGGSGYIGRAIARRVGASQCIVTHCQKPYGNSLRFRAEYDSFPELLRRCGPIDTVLILFGITKPDACYFNPQRAYAVNVAATRNIMRHCADRRIPFVFFSTELVFDGLAGPYDEQTAPTPKTVYGKHKAQIETYCLTHHPEALVIRLGRVVGSAPHDGTLLTQMCSSLMRGERLYCAPDQTFSPIHVNDLAEAVVHLLQTDARGLVNVAGPDGTSRYAMATTLARKLAEQGSTACAAVHRKHLHEFATPEPRPPDVTLRIHRLQQCTGFSPRGIDQIISAVARECHQHAIQDHFATA